MPEKCFFRKLVLFSSKMFDQVDGFDLFHYLFDGILYSFRVWTKQTLPLPFCQYLLYADLLH